MSKILGIDLGTTTSCCAIYEQGQVKVLQNAEGKRTTPSVVAFTKNGEILVGDAAQRQAITNPQSTIFSAKRFVGSLFKDRQKEASMVPYKVEEGKNGFAVFNIDGKQYTPQEISAKILAKMKQTAEDYLGESIKKAIITVPAYFNDHQRQATKDAAQIAGLEVLRLINEPTAASVAYGLDKKEAQKIAIVDIGGGTTDFSILEIGDGVIEVLSTSGDAHLAGDNLDEAIIKFLIDTFKAESGIDVSKDSMALQRLKEAAVKAKIELSSAASTSINLPFLSANNEGPKHLNLDLTRGRFEQLIDALVTKMFEPCHLAIKDAGLTVDQIDEVVLVGGSTRVPLIQQKAKEIFKKELNKSINPDEAVAAGAAIQGAALQGDVNDVLLLDVTPLSLGLETLGGVMTKLIERNSTIPTSKSQVFSTASDNQSAVTVKVFQGEREMANDNMLLGTFTLSDIPPAPKGIPQIQVSFDISVDGIVSVSAKDLGTGKEQSIKISGGSKLSDDDIKKMLKEAELNADADKKRRELIESKNHLDTMMFSTEKLLRDNGDKLDSQDKHALEIGLEEARKNSESSDIESLKKATQSLQEILHKATNALYQKSSQEPKKDDNVVDAEVG